MSRRWEVFYTYSVDASVRVEAESEEEARDKVTELWENGGDSNVRPKTLDYADFEILYVKKR